MVTGLWLVLGLSAAPLDGTTDVLLSEPGQLAAGIHELVRGNLEVAEASRGVEFRLGKTQDGLPITQIGIHGSGEGWLAILRPPRGNQTTPVQSLI
jgi:hypothetical protein